MKNIKFGKTEIFFLIVGLIHYIIAFCCTNPFSHEFFPSVKVVYFSCKILSFFIIIAFWQLIPFVIKSYKNNDLKIISFTRYTLFYWALNLLTAYFTYPTRDYFSGYENIFDYKYYVVETYCHFLNHFIPTLNYNIIPIDYASAICSTFVYSLIFAFCIKTVKEKISSKYYLLMLIPFCLPLTLMYNLHISRNIYSAWLFVFISFFIIFQKNKSYNNGIWYIFAFLCGILASFRAEYSILLLIFPFVFFILNLKKIITLLAIFFITFIGCYTINTIHSIKQEYALDNLIYIYCYFQESPYKDSLSETDYQSLKNVWEGIDELHFGNPDFGIYVEDKKLENLDNCNKAIKVLSKMLLDHPIYYMKAKVKEMNYQFENRYDVFQLLRCKIRILEHNNDKNYSCFLYGTNKFMLNPVLKVLYNPLLNYFLMFFILCYGLWKRKHFYTIQGFMWLSISIILILTVPFCRYLYYFPQVFNSWVIFFTALVDYFGNRKTT